MTITIETSGIHEVHKLLLLLKSLNIKKVSIKDTLPKQQLVITKGNKKLNPRELFGIWQDNPRTIEQYFIKAWK